MANQSYSLSYGLRLSAAAIGRGVVAAGPVRTGWVISGDHNLSFCGRGMDVLVIANIKSGMVGTNGNLHEHIACLQGRKRFLVSAQRTDLCIGRFAHIDAGSAEENIPDQTGTVGKSRVVPSRLAVGISQPCSGCRNRFRLDGRCILRTYGRVRTLSGGRIMSVGFFIGYQRLIDVTGCPLITYPQPLSGLSGTFQPGIFWENGADAVIGTRTRTDIYPVAGNIDIFIKFFQVHGLNIIFGAIYLYSGPGTVNADFFHPCTPV